MMHPDIPAGHFSAELSPTHGLIMAAGASRRMGRPKALLPYGDRTFVEHLIDRFSLVCETVTVVAGAHYEIIRCHLGDQVQIVRATDWQRGMRSSLRAGLLKIPPGPVLLTHVDRPTVSAETLSLLASAPGKLPVIPLYRGRAGHPVRIPDWLRDRLVRHDQTPLREIFKRSGLLRVKVADSGVIENINSRRDYDQLRAR